MRSASATRLFPSATDTSLFGAVSSASAHLASREPGRRLKTGLGSSKARPVTQSHCCRPSLSLSPGAMHGFCAKRPKLRFVARGSASKCRGERRRGQQCLLHEHAGFVQPLSSSSLNATTSPVESAHARQRPVRPNPSFKPTRYGRQRKPGPRHMVHHRVPGLRCLPPRAS
jgi:hypothetical protein